MMQSIAISLSADIIYVSGTVNGNAANFEYYASGIWKVVVPRSEDSIYHIQLQAIDSLERVTEFSTTIQYGFNAITTRGADSFYDDRDLNRVGSAINYIVDFLNEMGYNIYIRAKTNWTEIETFTSADGQVYLGYIEHLLKIVAVYPSTPALPKDLEELTYREANNIEQILIDMHALLINRTKAYYYSGELYSGEV